MFEQDNVEDVLCGVIVENGEASAIYCNTTTGECYFADPVMADDRLISELSVDSPVEVDVTDVTLALSQGDYGTCIAVIYDGDTIVKLLDDETAVRIPVDSPLSEDGEQLTVYIYGDYCED